MDEHPAILRVGPKNVYWRTSMQVTSKRLIRVIALLPLLALCMPASAQRTMGQLTTYYEQAGLNLSSYDKVLLDPLLVSYAKVVPPPWVEGKDRLPHNWAIDPTDIATMKNAYRDAMVAQLQSNDGYTIVDEPAEGALELTIAIISFTPYAKMDEQVITKGTGELTMQLQLRDAMTRKLLAVYEGQQSVGEEYQEHTRLTVEHNVQQLFSQWGMKVRLALDANHRK
jgi:hypothetical protein